MTSIQVKHLAEWVDSVGYSWQTWLEGDWCQPLHLISKLIAEEINERRDINTSGSKISFEDMMLMAEEFLGIPQLFIENDLHNKPSLNIALLTLVIQLKLETKYTPSEKIRKSESPMVFFVLNHSISALQSCPTCSTTVPIFDRVIVDGSSVFHRRCFLCVTCGKSLRKGGFKKSKNGFECLQHSARRILDQSDGIRLSYRRERPRVAPPPAPIPLPKPRSILPPSKTPYDEVSHCSTISADSGIVLKLDITTEIQPDNSTPPPVAPPRPKRASMLMSIRTTPPVSPTSSRRSSIECPTPKPRKSLTTNTDTQPKLAIEDYPNYLCPFGDDETEDNKASDYDESKNPFADSDEEDGTSVRSANSSLQSINTNSHVEKPERPVPPPKPARLVSMVCEEKFKTLEVCRKQNRAPLPPVITPQRRQIGFTERGVTEKSAVLLSKLEEFDDRFETLAKEGRLLEDALCSTIRQNPSNWLKNDKVGEWVMKVNQLLELIKEESSYVHRWIESYLNEIHSETEYLIRVLLDKEEKSYWELSREVELTNLLIAIIEEKSKLSESATSNVEAKLKDASVFEKNEKKKSKLKKRVALLKNGMRRKKI